MVNKRGISINIVDTTDTTYIIGLLGNTMAYNLNNGLRYDHGRCNSTWLINESYPNLFQPCVR